MAGKYVTLTAENLDGEHLCCALGDPKHREGVERKRAWLRARIAEGLVFRKLDVRGKVFIEYAPGERAWRPIVARGWLVIHCLWVSGQYAGQGHGRALLESCLEDARRQGKRGVVVASATRKRPFLADRRFFERRGFELVDRAGEFVLLARRLAPGGPEPRFADAVKQPGRAGAGFVARYTDQCPFNAHWAGEVQAALERAGEQGRLVHVTTLRDAQRVPSPLGAYGLERDGALVSHHLLTLGAARRMLERAGRALTAPRAARRSSRSGR